VLGGLVPLAFVQQQVLGLAARAVAVFLATLSVPGGAFVQVARGIYNGVMTFVEKGRQIAQVGTALLGSLGAIAAGQLAPAAQAVETTLVKVLPVALSFLAQWLGLGGIGQAVRDGLKKVQAPVEKAVNKVLDAVTDKAKTLWRKLKAGAGKVVDKGKQVATAVSDKVAGWLGLRKEFTLSNGEAHAVFFDEQGQLMLASTPHPYLNFLHQHPEVKQLPRGSQQHRAAEGLTDKLIQLSRERRLLDQQQQQYLRQQKRSAAVASLGQDRSTELAKNTELIDQVMQALATITLELMELSHQGAATPAQFKAVWASLAPGGFGGGVVVEYLTMGPTTRGSKRVKSAGTPAQGKGNSTYEALDRRRNGKASYYIQGHLLSEQLHGPGDTWRNLTPLSRSGNGQHVSQVESKLKDESLKDDPTKPRLFYYSAVPQYGRPFRQALIDELALPAVDPVYDADLKGIITAEQYVPRSLVCLVWEMDAIGKRRRAVVEKVVDNPIEQEGLFEYQLDRTPPFVNLNKLSFATELTPLLGARMSDIIWQLPTIQKQVAGNQVVFKGRKDLLTELSQTNRLTSGEINALDKRLAYLSRRKRLSF
jgi:hypothetical protein